MGVMDVISHGTTGVDRDGMPIDRMDNSRSDHTHFSQLAQLTQHTQRTQACSRTYAHTTGRPRSRSTVAPGALSGRIWGGLRCADMWRSFRVPTSLPPSLRNPSVLIRDIV